MTPGANLHRSFSRDQLGLVMPREPVDHRPRSADWQKARRCGYSCGVLGDGLADTTGGF